MLADLISEGTLEGLQAARARGRTGGRKPKLTTRQATVAHQMPSTGRSTAEQLIYVVRFQASTSTVKSFDHAVSST
jgi:DNA invertase Pin-like site-specific DNA recombinase